MKGETRYSPLGQEVATRRGGGKPSEGTTSDTKYAAETEHQDFTSVGP